MSGFAYAITGGKAERVAIGGALAREADLIWVHLSSNGDEAQTWLRDTAGLQPQIVDALTADETRPRCEAFSGGALINLRGRTSEDIGSDMLASLRIWGVKGRVHSVTRARMYAVDAVQREVEADRARDPGDLIAAFATAITEDLDPQVAQMGDDLDQCEQELSPDKVFELRRGVTKVRVAAIGYRRFLGPQRAALEKLASLPGDWLGDDDRLHLAAAADRAARMAEELESIRERAAVVHESLTDLRAEQIDSRSLIIGIVAVVFLPLTFVTGVYGMNVKGLPYADKPWSFDAIMGVSALISAAMVIYFVRRHWIGRA